MSDAPAIGLLDTSVFVALESGRALRGALLPDRLAVSMVTIGELRAGVLSAADGASRTRRLSTLTSALDLEPLVVDDAVAEAWARLRLALREQQLKMPVNDSWIAATALAHGMPVVTQDDDYVAVAGLHVIHV